MHGSGKSNGLFFLLTLCFIISPLNGLCQDCTDEEQTSQDSCISDAVTTCEDVNPACQNRVTTAATVRVLLIESCCCRGDSFATTAQFNACRNKKKKLFNRAAKIFPFDFRSSIKSVFSAASRDDCTACEF